MRRIVHLAPANPFTLALKMASSMKIFGRIFSLAVVILTWAGEIPNQPPIQVYYTGNMGIYIKVPGAGFLIDGLHDYYGPNYLHPDESLLHQIMMHLPPFDQVITLLNTHVHDDHYDSELTISYLRKHQTATLLAPQQVLDSLTQDLGGAKEIKSQCVPLTSQHLIAPSIVIRSGPIRHTYQQRHHWVENYFIALQVAGRTIIHLGDSEASADAFDEVPIFKNVDLVIVPFWFLLSDEGLEILEQKFQSKRIMVTHISPLIDADMLDSMKTILPGIIICTELNQTLEIQN
ncbi:MAG: hypothetical protein OEQ53_20880 [Saprospiraceae bacterium]|nr:hypothetical protein [Saprospiraceae bacterium]